MDIELDPAKDESNIAKHGVSLALGAEMDMETAVVVVDDRRDYGEQRFNALGLIAGRVHAMTFAIRPPAVRIISLRKANKREQKRFTA
ncbi:BrnT family toxin [Brevundimonas faecalis]|uniref:BrnT family toxin n=1 Tax=Brevundimonas faecalis TaxID=947378 RepID=UPI00361AAE33